MQNQSLPRQLTSEEVDTAGAVLAAAFQDDPLWVYLYPEAAQRRRYVQRCFAAVAAFAIASRRAYGAGEPLQAVAVWEFPGQPSPKLSAAALRGFLRLGASPFLLRALGVRSVFAAFDRMHKQYVTGPHYYLQTIGVSPPAQGQGLSSQLIRPFVRAADARSVGVYTETMTPANVGLYEHFGLRCTEEAPIAGTDLRVWAFYRAGAGQHAE
jgi:ribosomal protein S18 acetylase RimI-like enzyme